jgi:signal transduction histidine kinase
MTLDRNPGGRSPWPFDVALTVALLLPAPLVSAGVLLPVPLISAAGTSLWGLPLSVLEIAPLVLRRVRPTLSFALITATMCVQLFTVSLPVWGQVAVPVAAYSVAAYAPRSTSRAALAIGLVGAVLGPARWLTSNGAYRYVGVLTMAVVVLLAAMLVLAPWTLGTLARTRRAYVEGVIERSQRIAREAEQRAELAAAGERARIAREMHDVVAHGLSVMIVQADGARYAVDQSPQLAARALETIAATGRESLAEMRRMLGLLRSDDALTGTEPQPGLEDLAELVAQAVESGMRLSADITEPLPAVAPGIGLTVYRCAQEALTNTRKHAGPDVEVHLSVRVIGADLVVEVLDDGRGAAADGDGQGHGLVGMRERVAVHGGHLEAGPRPGGGFAVRVRIPLLFKVGQL